MFKSGSKFSCAKGKKIGGKIGLRQRWEYWHLNKSREWNLLWKKSS